MGSSTTNPDPSRRRFLSAGAMLGAGLIVLPGCGNDARETNDPPGNGTSGDDKQPAEPATVRRGHLGTVIGPGKSPGEQYWVGIVDLDDELPKVRTISDIHFFGHGVSPNPVKPGAAVIFEKHGKGCAEVDLRQARTLRKIETVRGREFYGHGAFTPDGKTLYATETIIGDNSYQGVVAIRDGESFDLMGNFPTFGIAPHDCILIDDGNTLVITNGGGPLGNENELPSVTYVDVPTQSLKKKLTFPTREINAGHLAITARGDLVVVSAPRDGMDTMKPGSISFYSPGGEVRTVVDEPVRAKMLSETLSVAIHEPSMIVGATNPKGHLITFWDFKTGKLIKSLDGAYKNPRGISVTLDNRYFVVTYDQQTHMVLLDAETFEPVQETFIDQTFMSGSHNLVYDLPA